jgi:hypothetical protein
LEKIKTIQSVVLIIDTKDQTGKKDTLLTYDTDQGTKSSCPCRVIAQQIFHLVFLFTPVSLIDPWSYLHRYRECFIRADSAETEGNLRPYYILYPTYICLLKEKSTSPSAKGSDSSLAQVPSIAAAALC